MAQKKVLLSKIELALKKGNSVDLQDEDNEKLLCNALGLLLANISSFTIGTQLLSFCFQNPEDPDTIKCTFNKIVLDPMMSSRWAHECIYQFLKECADASLDSSKRIYLRILAIPGYGPGHITLTQEKTN